MIKWMMKIIMTIMIKRSYWMMGYGQLGGMGVHTQESLSRLSQSQDSLARYQ